MTKTWPRSGPRSRPRSRPRLFKGHQADQVMLQQAQAHVFTLEKPTFSSLLE